MPRGGKGAPQVIDYNLTVMVSHNIVQRPSPSNETLTLNLTFQNLLSKFNNMWENGDGIHFQ